MSFALEMLVNGGVRTSLTSSTNSWNPSFSFSRSFSTLFGGLGSLLTFSALTSAASPVMAFTWFFDAVLVWFVAKKRKLSVTKAQAMIAAQRMIEPITSRLPYGLCSADAELGCG